MILLITVLSGCEHLKSNSPSIKERPTDICTSGITTFSFDDDELKTMSRKNKENAAMVNCTLYLACGYEVNNPDMCTP